MNKKISKKILALSILLTLVLVPTTSNAEGKFLYGRDRYSTNRIVNSEANLMRSETIIIASGELFPDALSAGNISSMNKFPLILVNEYGDNIYNMIKYYTSAKNIIIVGGAKTVSTDHDKNLSKKYNITRIAGKDRYETSENVYKYLSNNTNDTLKKVGVKGNVYSDALSAIPYAKKIGGVVILSNNSDNKFDTIIGGGVLGKAKKTISGQDKYDTSRKIVNEIHRDNLIIVDGENFPDALSASSLSGVVDGNILLASMNINDSDKDYIKSVKNPIFIGGEAKDIGDFIFSKNIFTGVVPKQIHSPSYGYRLGYPMANNLSEVASIIKDGLADSRVEEVKLLLPKNESVSKILLNLINTDNFLAGFIESDTVDYISTESLTDRVLMTYRFDRNRVPAYKYANMLQDLNKSGGIVERIKHEPDEMKKMKILVEYNINLNGKYDYDNLKNPVTNNILDAHYRKKSMCRGYSSYIAVIGEMGGLNTKYIADEKISTNHAWVKITISNGQEYGIDTVRMLDKKYSDYPYYELEYLGGILNEYPIFVKILQEKKLSQGERNFTYNFLVENVLPADLAYRLKK